MNKTEKILLKLGNEIASIDTYENQEELLDQMTLSYLESEKEKKAEAYFLVMNLKKLLKACSENHEDERLDFLSKHN